jgi:acyl carrier protein
MATDRDSLETALIGWIGDWLEGGDGTAVDAETDLTGGGLLDSMAVVALVAFLEDRAGAGFDFGTFYPGGGVTVRGLVQHCVGSRP